MDGHRIGLLVIHFTTFTFLFRQLFLRSLIYLPRPKVSSLHVVTPGTLSTVRLRVGLSVFLPLLLCVGSAVLFFLLLILLRFNYLCYAKENTLLTFLGFCNIVEAGRRGLKTLKCSVMIQKVNETDGRFLTFLKSDFF